MRCCITLGMFALLGCSETTGPIPPPPPAGQPARGLLYVLPPPGDTVGPVYLAEANGSNPRQLRWYQTVDEAGTLFQLLPSNGPVFSPDGNHVAFSALRSQIIPYPLQPWLATISDSSARRMGCQRDATYRRWAPGLGFSPDESLVAYNCSGPFPPLTVVDTGLTKPAQLIYPPDSFTRDGAVAWSPDGRWILNGDLLERTDGTIVQLSMPSGMIGLGWAPNGWIIVGPKSLCGTGVYWMGPEQGAKVVKLLDAPYRYAAFSPDSKKLLALTSVCSPTDRPEARLLDRATLAIEWSMPGATWATWRP